MNELCGMIDNGKRFYFVDEISRRKIEKCEKCFFNDTMCRRVVIEGEYIFARESKCNLLKD